MIRRNFYLLLTLTLVYAGCNDNSTNIENLSSVISGKIVNLHYSPGLYVVGTVTEDDTSHTPRALDSSLISSDGSFSLTVSEPPSHFLAAYTLPNCPGNVHISSNNVGYVGLVLYIDSLGKHIGTLQRSNISTDSVPPYPVGWFVTLYSFLNMACTITGTDTCVYQQDTTIYTYQVNFNKGWNTYSMVSEFTSNTKQIWYGTSQQPSGGKWYISRLYYNFTKGFKKQKTK